MPEKVNVAAHRHGNEAFHQCIKTKTAQIKKTTIRYLLTEPVIGLRDLISEPNMSSHVLSLSTPLWSTIRKF